MTTEGIGARCEQCNREEMIPSDHWWAPCSTSDCENKMVLVPAQSGKRYVVIDCGMKQTIYCTRTTDLFVVCKRCKGEHYIKDTVAFKKGEQDIFATESWKEVEERMVKELEQRKLANKLHEERIQKMREELEELRRNRANRELKKFANEVPRDRLEVQLKEAKAENEKLRNAMLHHSSLINSLMTLERDSDSDKNIMKQELLQQVYISMTMMDILAGRKNEEERQ